MPKSCEDGSKQPTNRPVLGSEAESCHPHLLPQLHPQNRQGDPGSDPALLPCTVVGRVHTQSSWEEAICLPSTLLS